jgi:hypothetical protein
MTMQKDEKLLLQTWIEFHAKIFTYNNLCIVDNGSVDPEVCRILEMYKGVGVNVIDTLYTNPTDFDNKGTIMAQVSEAYDDADFVFFLDCDEFLGVWRQGKMSFDKGDIIDHLMALPKDNQYVYVIDKIYSNMPFQVNKYRQDTYTKVFFRGGTIKTIDRGFHDGETLTDGPHCPTDMLQVHMHHKPYNASLQCARDKMKMRVDVDDPEALQSYRGPGAHLIPILLCTEQEYYWSFLDQDHIYSRVFRDTLASYGLLIQF